VVSIDCVCFLCLVFDAGASASSSPEASREEGCCITAISDFRRSLGMCEALFRLTEPLEEGDDISTSVSYRPCVAVQENLQLELGEVVNMRRIALGASGFQGQKTS
jgi:hypothetical protein